MKKKISLIAAFFILLIGLSSAITIEIDIFNFGGDSDENATQGQQQNQSQEQQDPRMQGRETTVEEQEEVDPSEQNNMDNNPITGGDESGGLASMIKDLISSFL